MIGNPLALIAEVTHRCPLRCVYCSNPLNLVRKDAELSTTDWIGIFQQARALGVLHLHLTGGEPAVRTDLEQLIAGARETGLYTNLITSGVGISERRLDALIGSGLDHIQLSFQDSQIDGARRIAGVDAHAHKIKLAEKIRQHSIAFTVNLVVHRQNLDHIEELIDFVEQLQPQRIEIANTQYYGWAILNRDSLLPTPDQLERCMRAVNAAQARLAGQMRVDCVVPDYYARYPKACMGGWGRRLMLITPSGEALPCHAAGVIPGLQFANVRHHTLEWIWNESTAFQKFRGDGWMQDPCRSCERKSEDFGGCRCQAFLLTGNAEATDPVCTLSPDHHLIETIRASANTEPTQISWLYRSAAG